MRTIRWPWRRRGGRSSLPCIEVVEIVTDYLEGALPAADRARLETHLDGCEGCRAYLDQMRTTIRMVGRLREETIPPELRARLLAAFRDASP